MIRKKHLQFPTELRLFMMEKVEQLGAPKEIYTRPNNMFVANFIGTSGFLDGTAENGVVSISGSKRRLRYL